MNFEIFDAMIKEKFAVSIYDYGGYYDTSVIKELREWCDTNIGTRNYRNSFSTFYFMTDQQRLMFLLRCS